MKCRWDDSASRLIFESDVISGEFIVDAANEKTLCNHRLANLIHRPSSTRLTTEEAKGAMPRFGFSLFRILARDAYLTELRAVRPYAIPHKDAVRLVWEPSIRHQVKVSALFAPKDPNVFDVEIEIEGCAYYPDFEMLVSNYAAPGFHSGAYVRKSDFHDQSPDMVLPIDNAVYHGMYNFFPRDERTASILADGRGQRGRWYWRVNCGRFYSHPLAFCSNGSIDLLLMGREEDVAAVGATYSGDESEDGVADHRAQYLSLFGRDLHPGEGWRTNVRVVMDEFRQTQDDHLAQYESFKRHVSSVARRFEVEP